MAPSNRTLVEQIINNPESFQRSHFDFEGISYGPMKFNLLPTFFDKGFNERAKQASATVTRLIKSLPQRIFGLDPQKIAAYFGIAPEIAQYLMNGYSEDHVDAMLGRGDFLLTSQGLKCLEQNLGAKLGGWEHQIWRAVYLERMEFVGFLNKHKIHLQVLDTLTMMIHHMVRHAMSVFAKDRRRTMHCAVIMPQEKVGSDKNLQSKLINLLYRQILKQHDPSQEGELFMCGNQELEARGNSIYYDGHRISVVVELNHGMVPRDVYVAYVQGEVIVFNGPLTSILSNKLNLALLSDPRNAEYFSEEELENIARYIPWTRKTEPVSTIYKDQKIDLKEFTLSNKDMLVIKPSDEFGGFGISVGRALTQEKWENAVDVAFREQKWVVQEYIESIHFLYQSRSGGLSPHKMVLGFFQFGSEYSGCLLRIMEQGAGREVINSHQGAEVSVVFEIE